MNPAYPHITGTETPKVAAFNVGRFLVQCLTVASLATGVLLVGVAIGIEKQKAVDAKTRGGSADDAIKINMLELQIRQADALDRMANAMERQQPVQAKGAR